MTGRPAFGARWPWVTRRRLAWLVVVLVGAGVAIPWHHRAKRREFLAQAVRVLPMSASLSADAIGDWAAMHASQARTLAAVAARTAPPGAAARAMGPILPAVAREGGYAEARIDPVAPVGPRQVSPETLTPGDGDSLAFTEFSAIIGDSAVARERIVLRAALSEAALAHFNIAARDDRTQRTLLLLRPRHVGPDAGGAMPDALRLIIVSEAGGAHEPLAAAMPTGITPASLQRAWYATAGAIRTRPHGIGTGIAGTEVVYATAAVPGTPWLLVRERETAELLARIDPALYFTDAVFAALVVLVLGVLMLRWRAKHQRLEIEAVRLRSTFVASVSHELRTPLTQVRMYAEMLRLGILDSADDRDRALRVIEKEAERLGQLIERALTFVRTGQAPPPEPEASVALHEAVQRAVDAIAPLAAERDVVLQADVDAAVTVHIARDDLHQILLNLIDNAIKYGPAGQTVTMTAQRNGSLVRLMVRDQGPGVPAAERRAIWEPYRRGQAASIGTVTGTGIGLVVVKALVERAGGEVSVTEADAPEGRTGALFVVQLPAGA